MESNLKIMVVIGTRPEIIKTAPVIREIINRNLKLQLIHTGQHYDFEMSESFFQSLKLPKPLYNLNVGHGTNIMQISAIIKKLGDLIPKLSPDIILAQGDTNSVLAAALTANKLKISFGHIEAGIRSYDMTMPEEINRKIADSISNFHFVPSYTAYTNLLLEGVNPSTIYITGNTIVDATLQHFQYAKNISTGDLSYVKQFIKSDRFIICTIHRQVNVDVKKNLEEILTALNNLSEKNIKIVFPIHPRTLKRIYEFQLYDFVLGIKNLLITKPLDYLSFLYLMSKTSLIMTDSGGIQEEAITLKKPCITIRKSTERPETLSLQMNKLVKAEASNIVMAVENTLNNIQSISDNFVNPYGDGTAAKKILDIIIENQNKFQFKEQDFIDIGVPTPHFTIINKDIKLGQFEEEHGIIKLVFDYNGKMIKLPNNLRKGYAVVFYKKRDFEKNN